jgi:hypothetical protein
VFVHLCHGAFKTSLGSLVHPLATPARTKCGVCRGRLILGVTLCLSVHVGSVRPGVAYHMHSCSLTVQMPMAVEVWGEGVRALHAFSVLHVSSLFQGAASGDTHTRVVLVELGQDDEGCSRPSGHC